MLFLLFLDYLFKFFLSWKLICHEIIIIIIDIFKKNILALLLILIKIWFLKLLLLLLGLLLLIIMKPKRIEFIKIKISILLKSFRFWSTETKIIKIRKSCKLLKIWILRRFSNITIIKKKKLLILFWSNFKLHLPIILLILFLAIRRSF